MTSKKQVAANRRNARKSTGPKTRKGKAAVQLNALKHGLLSQQVLLPDEDKDELVALGQGLRSYLQPVGALEDLLVERIIVAAWRLHRLGWVEVEIFQFEKADLEADATWRDIIEGYPLGQAFIRQGQGADAFSKLSRYEAAIERGLYRALHELQRLQAARLEGNIPASAVVDVDVSVSESVSEASGEAA